MTDSDHDAAAREIIRTAIQDYADLLFQPFGLIDQTLIADYSPLDDQRMSDGTADLIISRLEQAGLVIREKNWPKDDDVCLPIATLREWRQEAESLADSYGGGYALESLIRCEIEAFEDVIAATERPAEGTVVISANDARFIDSFMCSELHRHPEWDATYRAEVDAVWRRVMSVVDAPTPADGDGPRTEGEE